MPRATFIFDNYMTQGNPIGCVHNGFIYDTWAPTDTPIGIVHENKHIYDNPGKDGEPVAIILDGLVWRGSEPGGEILGSIIGNNVYANAEGLGTPKGAIDGPEREAAAAALLTLLEDRESWALPF